MVCCFASLVPCSSHAQQTRPREHFQNADVVYDWVTNSRKDKLRTFISHPRNARFKVPVLFFVGWLSCDSVESPQGETDGFSALLLRLIDQSDYATVRTEKPGVGESQGTPCDKADFQGELEGYQAAFESMSKYEFLDPDRAIVIGLSNGGGFAPLVSKRHAVRAFVAAGSWGRTWYEHMLENERVRLTTEGKYAAEVNHDMKAFAEFYDLYLIQGETPGQILSQHAQWRNLWYDAPGGQYGRPAAFYQQLQALNLGKPGRSLAKRRCTGARHSRLEGHGHEPRRQLRDRRNGEPRAPGEGPLSGNGRHDPRLYRGEEVSRRNGHRYPELGQGAIGEGSSQLENGRNGQVEKQPPGRPG